MFPYHKNLCKNFKFKFSSLEEIEQNHSQALQDMFVLAALNGKRNGSFLEIGAFDPVIISNTYLLESKYDWKGVSIDIDPSVPEKFQRYNRRACLCGNALTTDYNQILKNFGSRMDYLSLDIEPSDQTLRCLEILPLDKVRFSVITYETDAYNCQDDTITKKSREILISYGYTLVAGNISDTNTSFPFEDWYLDSTFFDKKTIDLFKRADDAPITPQHYMLEGKND